MNLGPMEVLVILVVAVLIFGPKNLPKLGSALGKTVRNVREGMEGTDESEDSSSPKSDSDE
ncbi:MAG: twin-arginine translocase TatA/TatE family subunit [Coriobacteriales bacterium]|nr:twin-arginine translocase TatA/TatE family subunit [Coriobacteriales bacterium]